MSKKVLVVVSTPRKGGNSEILSEQFAMGAKESGNIVETIFLRDKKIAPCLACEVCINNGGICVQKDDMADILEKIVAADVIVLSTPVYYFSICAQLKIMIDRSLAAGKKMKDKEFYFIMTAADKKETMETTMNDMQGYVTCIPGSVVKGKVYGSAYHAGVIRKKPAMQEAYEYGKNC